MPITSASGQPLSAYSQPTQVLVKAWHTLIQQTGPAGLKLPWVLWWTLYQGMLAGLYVLAPGFAWGIAAAGLLGSVLVAASGNR